jgi:membrane associated rhomboid family serine protease
LAVSVDPYSNDGQAFPLRGSRESIVLRADGMDHPVHARSRRRVFTAYADITHLTTSTHAVWIGTKSSVYILGRGMFAQTGGPENLLRALSRRIAEQPGGAAQLARMAEIERAGHRAGPLRATWAMAGICVAVFFAQLLIGPTVEAVGNFTPYFFRDGDLWRIVTANLVHAAPEFPIHLGLNMLALIVLGTLVERPLGATRTVTVMGVSGATAMLASGVVDGVPVVGASGVVFGLVGSALWLEFTWAERLPAWWRYPRRSLLILLALNGVLGFVIPIISGSAHLGGFLGGLAVTALMTRDPRGFDAAPRWVPVSSALVVLLTVAAVWSAGWELSRPGDFAARHAARLASLPDISAVELNDTAWMIAISPEPSREMVEAALILAERAVAETNRLDPNVLDTLAEVQFVLGWREEAIRTIDEAIAQAPAEPYFREQRRRFTGERDADDRPAAPLPPWIPRPDPEAEPEGLPVFEEPGLTV